MKHLTLSNFIMLGIGAVIGVVATNQYFKNKYAAIAEEEIESVRELYRSKNDEEIDDQPQETDKEESVVEENLSVREYATMLNQQGYTNYANIENDDSIEKNAEGVDVKKPYVIQPEQFGELDDYEIISLTYYADKFLTDDADELIEDVEALIGRDSLSTFGQFEEDAVYVRNDRLKCDYEILADTRNYVDIRKERTSHRISE